MRAFLIKNVEEIITAFVFLITYSFIFVVLNYPDFKSIFGSISAGVTNDNALKYLFADTTLTGGDTGSHVYILYYLRQIFPLVKWWSPDWYSGFPFLYFYPPLMYIITVLLSYVIPINIAFKIVTLAAVLIFPIAFYLCLKWLKFKFPVPALAALFSVFLIFLEKHTIYGGNLPSALSGQFSHTASIALLFIFIGLFVRGFEKERYIAAILIGAAVILTHPISGLIVIFIMPFLSFALKGDVRSILLYTASVFLGIFLLSSFWTLGLINYRDYGGTMIWAKEIKWDYVFPSHWHLVIFGTFLGIIYAVWKKEVNLLPVLGILILSSFGFLYLDHSSIWNTRFLPYISCIMILLAAYFWGSALGEVKKKSFSLSLLYLIVICVTCLFIVQRNTSFSQSWFKWNYEGYQKKLSWPELESLFSYLQKLPQGRVMWEYHPDYEKYGTTRVMEMIPVFSKQPTYEGLLIESSIIGPFHFINQAETSEKPTCAIAGFSYPPFDFNKGIKHIKLLGASYFIAYSNKVKNEADKNQDLTKLRNIGPFSIYKLASHIIEPVRYLTVQLKNKDWQKRSIEWYKGEHLDQPIIFVENHQEKDRIEKLTVPVGILQIPQNIKITRDRIEFDAPVVNIPYLVKISYFPTWRVEGAKALYLVSPAYMLVVPTEKHVRLFFTYGWVDWLGMMLSFCGIIYLFNAKKIVARTKETMTH
jgi:hypothetical protein